jgi:phosphoserine aminotransferase
MLKIICKVCSETLETIIDITKTILKMVWSYLKAKTGPKATDEIATSRYNTCSTCSWHVQKDTREYCRGCGCFQSTLWPDAELKTKTKFLYATCPRNKWET